ncbi:MAG: RrF2 family transcriptional regulator [Clostridiales bacterium]|jgi:Rrf2 family protein|nr:RrF2 family transcriptional regulator [Clostridiales bacterium]
MKISTKGRYALRMMIDLALHDAGGFIPLKDISERQDITAKYLEQIITSLSKAGLVKSSRGNNGGYRLSRAPENITAGEILRITEGSLAPVACLDDEVNQCPRSETCLTLPFWKGLQNIIDAYVDGATLYDFIKNTPAADTGNFCI